MRLFGLDIRRAVRAQEPISEVEWAPALKRLEMRCTALEDELSQLQGHHLKLRKQFDGSKGGRPVAAAAAAVNEIPVGDKAALRAYGRQIGLIN